MNIRDLVFASLEAVNTALAPFRVQLNLIRSSEIPLFRVPAPTMRPCRSGTFRSLKALSLRATSRSTKQGSSAIWFAELRPRNR